MNIDLTPETSQTQIDAAFVSAFKAEDILELERVLDLRWPPTEVTRLSCIRNVLHEKTHAFTKSVLVDHVLGDPYESDWIFHSLMDDSLEFFISKAGCVPLPHIAKALTYAAYKINDEGLALDIASVLSQVDASYKSLSTALGRRCATQAILDEEARCLNDLNIISPAEKQVGP